MANKRINEAGNVALELVLAVSLAVSVLFPGVESLTNIYRSRTELHDASAVLARVFQKSPVENLRQNLSDALILIQRQSDRHLRLRITYLDNTEGLPERLVIKASINTNEPFIRRLHTEHIALRADFVS